MELTFGTYQRVLIVGIDGMGAFNRFADTPNIDRVFARGAVTHTALAAKPTISTACWTTMLTGAIPEVHGLIHSLVPPAVPTIFRLVKDAFPDAETAVFSGWSPIANEIVAPGGGADTLDAGDDDALCERILAYLDDHDPTLLFVQLDHVDGAGHTTGYGSRGHLDAIAHADEQFGQIYAKYEARGLLDDTLVIVTADHGGTVHCSHGDWSDGERFVFFGAAGKNVLHGEIGAICQRDYPAIVLHALGITPPPFAADGYAAQMPTGIFPDAGTDDRKPVYPVFSPYIPQKRTQPGPDSPEYIGTFLNPERIRFWLTFENGTEDVTHNCTTTVESGIIKTYNNGFVGKSGEFGAGILRIDGMTHGDVFSFAFWYFTSPDCRWMDLFSNADGVHNSFTIAPYGECVGIYVKAPDGTQLYERRVAVESYEASALNQWTHFIFEVNCRENRITAYVNFEEADSTSLPYPLAEHFDLSVLRMAADQHNRELFFKVVDDVMVIDGMAEPAALRAYYRI